MHRTPIQTLPTAAALAAALLLAACGGGDASGPPDSAAPTLLISDSVAAATLTATTAVTFNFAFSEDVGSSFSADDITVAGGTAAALVQVDATNYTLVVTPVADAAGSITVSVAAGRFNDLANNANAAAATAQQAYDTRVVVVPPVVATGTTLVSFDEAAPATADMGAYGGAVASVEPAPSGGSGNALKILKPVSPDTWGGSFFTVARLPFTATRKVITARVYATRANALIRLKVEVAGGPSVEVAGTTTGAANTWSTVSWDLAGVDPALAYTVIAITPDRDLVASGQAYHIDELTLAPAANVVPPPPVGATFVSFDEATPAFSAMGAYGGAVPTVEAAPSGGSGNALKLVKPVGARDDGGNLVNWGGVFFTTATIPFTADNKTITARVYSSRAAAVLRFKVEVPGGGSVEVAGTPTGAANTWGTVTWDFSTVNLASTYKIIAITPDAETVPSGQVYYIDDIKVAAAGVGATSWIVQPFVENLQSAYDTATSKARTGNYETGHYAAPSMVWWWGGAFKSKIQGGYGVSLANVNDSYFGMFIKNGATGWDISAATKYLFNLGTNGECVGRCTATVRLVSAAGANCVADVQVPLTSAAPAAYSRNLSDFTVSGCANNTMAAFKQSRVAELHFQMLRAGMQFATTTDAGGRYPNGLDMGDSIGFDAPTGAPATANDPVIVGPVLSSLTFDEAALAYTSTEFGGTSASIGTGPAGSTGKVLKVNKLAGAEAWAGVTVSTGANFSIDKIPFTTAAKRLSLRVWAPAANMKVRLKVEDASDVTHNCETDATTTLANGWQTLVFDFGTRAFNNGDPTQLTSNRCVDNALLLVSTMNKLSVFPNFGTAGAVNGDFYFDDITFVGN